ncbi:DUF4270 domain-containing protein [Dysgonomonas sp. Marseille-P4677]|uniref:DUF4270 domain-containing protein n=1 Tax=Dysgonomonas sp. Marseille-P4677 TaxID=2364790 RepID=UPI0019146209|nr:DUF4270 domain-containing protein [Dysgonomonas sp. Marseille-P4677]MBK5719495.1 DUF4270 domain-containing protein [Dysgonomonas sp. Marseille-P4677]
MKIKTLLSLFIAFFAIIFVACEDNLGQLGESIQPEKDDINAKGDTIDLRAATYSFEDSVYARTEYGLLGEYIDPIFGKVKSDYMTELFCPEDIEFKNPNNKKVTIDSVFLNTEFTYFTGDTVAPMGLSVYEVTKPLKAFFFTSVDPAKYTDNMSKLLGQNIFSIQDLPNVVESGYRIRTINTQLDLSLGERFYNEWLESKDTFKNSDAMSEFFKGIYVTTTFGSGTLIRTDQTSFNIYYTYQIRNVANTADSAAVGIFHLPVTPEVIQMNHVKNTLPTDMLGESDVRTYMKTPAGVYTEFTIPLDDIMKTVGKDRVINAANFKVKGFTEEEEKSGLIRPSYVLVINKDSLENYFYDKRYSSSNKTSFVISRNTSSNTYDLGNLASVINYYADYYKSKGQTELPDLKYLMIPVDATPSTTTSGAITDIYNQMYPTSAILRTDPPNMKMTIISSKY